MPSSPGHKHVDVKVKPEQGATSPKISPNGGIPTPIKRQKSVEKTLDEDEVNYEVPEYDDYKEDDHTIMKNQKKVIKGLLHDFGPYNEAVIQRHKMTPNTKVKLLQAIDRWFLSEESERPRVMVIGCNVGMGKTCLMTEVCSKYEAQLAGSHYFCFNSANIGHNNLKAVIISLAYRFCDMFTNYISMLPGVDKLRELISHGDATDLYNALLFHPLTNPSLDHDTEKHMLIVIDALDECNLEDRDLLLDVVKNLNENSPEWLYLLATTHNENQILSHVEGVYSVEIKSSKENMVDIKKYLREPLGRFMDRISLDGGLNQLVKKTEGSFLCGYVLKRRLDGIPSGTNVAMREIDHMYENGLSANCRELFLQFRESLAGTRAKKDAYRNILSILVAAKEPLHIDFISSIVGEENVSDVKNSLDAIAPVLINDSDQLSLCSVWISEWLLDQQESGECCIDGSVGHEQLASLCIQWLGDIAGETQTPAVSNFLKQYALKHVVYHLLDVPKQHENVAKVLCSLRYIQEKLNLEGVCVSHILADYHHQHIQTYKGTNRLITLKEYMKKHSKTFEQIRCYEKFVVEKKYDIKQCSEFVLQIAANYSQMERMQSNARVELEDKPWIEDVTAVPETHCVVRNLGGSIRAADVSADGKAVAVIIKDEEYNVRLHIINTSTGEQQIQPVDIKSLNDRVGLQAKFMPDGNNIFVGSLTTFITKVGKRVGSGIDVRLVELKEKFSIECCDVSPKHFVTGLTTFPWGGRSLHLCVFDVRTKKCLKTIEVLRFRFGGSAQFGIKCISAAKERPLMCAVVKQSTKPQLRVIVYNISKFQVINSIDTNNEDITKCLFVSDHTLILGSSIRSATATKSSVAFTPVVSDTWNFKEVKNKISQVWDEKETSSVISTSGDNTVACRWYASNSTAVVECWTTDKINDKPQNKYKIQGLIDVGEMMSGENMLVFVSHDEIMMYNINDLDVLDKTKGSNGAPSLAEALVESFTFLPRTDTAILVVKQDDLYSVYLCDFTQEDMTLIPTPFSQVEIPQCKTIAQDGQFKSFRGAGASTELCFPSADGNFLIFNRGNQLQMWDRAKDVVRDVPSFDALKDTTHDFIQFTGIKGFASMKENLLAVVYGQLPHKVYLYDIRSGQVLKKLEQPNSSAKRSVLTDLAFLPSNGFVMSYHRHLDNSLTAWNPRTGELLSTASVHISYAKVSPASDRLVISARKDKREGQLILRNSDNTFTKTLFVGSHHTWLPSAKNSDLEFSGDGTILVGICVPAGICRVWNAGNGEVLQDLPPYFTCTADVLGMLTNTHVVFHNDRLVVMDVASGEVHSVLPLDHNMDCKISARGLRVSPKGSVLAGATTSGHMCVFHVHNFVVVKRKTTLQRMKSFRK